ncbi:MAG: phenylalanine--tRNA ligase subunit alpha [Thermoplasmata archaeon]
MAGGGPPPDEAGPAADLPEAEARLLRLLRSRPLPFDEEEIPIASGLAPDTVRGSLQRLRAKRLARVEERSWTERRLTPRGEAALTQGLPERRLLDALARGADDPSSLDAEERSAAIGILRRRGFLRPEIPLALRPDAPDPAGPLPEEIALRGVADGKPPAEEGLMRLLERRGLVRSVRRTERRWSPSEEGLRFPLDAPDRPRIGALTSALLASGRWREGTLRPYDVRAPVPFVSGPRPHPYLAWLEAFEEILVGLGFEEAEGPLVETEFWNADALFMPQDHPARSIHDALAPAGLDGHDPPPALRERVAAAHEGRPLPGEERAMSLGWTDRYDPAIARRPVLRTQTTAVSARFLARAPPAPFRMYSIGRNFRAESIDASHHVEFAQAEGILGQEGASIRELLGIFRTLAEAIGIREIKVRPSYFPFTEPSVEGYVRHPRLGWIETFPGGILRPEVVRPFGIDVPVLAWGIGIARLAMVALGCNDVRELFEDDLDALSGRSP